jgi:hypothetical protein
MHRIVLIAMLALTGHTSRAQLGLTKKEIISKYGAGYEEIYKEPGKRLFMQYIKQKGDGSGLYQEMHEYSFGRDNRCNNINVVTPERNKKAWLKKFSTYENSGGSRWYDKTSGCLWTIEDIVIDGYIVISCSNGKV